MQFAQGKKWFIVVLAFNLLLFSLVGSGLAANSKDNENKIISVGLDTEADHPTIAIKTEEPVGYRYTVYDSSDPVRVVVDFPGVDVSEIESPVSIKAYPIEEVRLSSFDLSSGKLGRIELVLAEASDYDVVVSEGTIRVAFPKGAEPVGEVPVGAVAESVVPVAAETLAADEGSPPKDTAEQVPAAGTGIAPRPASMITSPEINPNEVLLVADGSIEKLRYFPLGAPPRLVVDAFGVRPDFEARSFRGAGPFEKIRIGTYKEKTRFVFDAQGERLPDYTVEELENAVAVRWAAQAAAQSRKHPASLPPSADVPLTVESLDFDVEDGRSVLTVDLSGDPRIIDPSQEGDTVRFGIRNANISRALRRSIDASAFPSAVRLITPYLVQVDDIQDVRFVAELKGPVDYDLEVSGSRVLFIVENGPFAEPAPAAAEQVEVPVPEQPAGPQAVAMAAPEGVDAITATAPTPEGTSMTPVGIIEAPEPESVYTGEKITLVFDDADIRRIFQLIAEVSDLNMLVGDEVKGQISLRLIDVPWDQALDLILDIKNLGMLREGNVVRILPRDTIREMRQAELTAVKEERDLEPLVTEVIGVSYTDLGNIAGPASELLTDRGKITPDNRNKQLIVTDIPSVIDEVRRLVAILDTPERQVMIEARIVEANTNFTRDLGVSWNFSYEDDSTSGQLDDLSAGSISGGGNFVIDPSIGSPGLGSSFTFGSLGLGSTVLDLRLSAAESAGQSKVISKPRVATLNGEAAVISQGTQIPYQSVSDQGTKTEFVDATLQLDVTPIINPDDSIILEIKATNNTPTTVAGASAPGINKKEATTKVLVQNGETTVLGGIFTESKADSEAGIPLLRKIPILGHLFKSTNKTNDRSELLIFITPRILN